MNEAADRGGDGSADPLAADDLRPGTRLGRYELLVSVAQGGMARVWAARQHGMRGFTKLVAVKTILPALASDPEFQEMFLDEARVAAGVHHPNVCETFDLGEQGSVLYIAMEWVAGDSLSLILRGPGRAPAPLDPRMAARIVADACAGLHAAHELTDDLGERLWVVHRDVSPHNILVHENGTVKVVDFGVAKALGRTQATSSAGQLKGKVAYMSPEQAAGADVDLRSDLYAMGIVLYEATTGQRPFRGDNDVVVLRNAAAGAFDRPSSLVRGYPAELEAIVLRAMDPDPGRRYASADAMRQALEAWLARTGPAISAADVAQLVRERVGDRIEQRKRKIREAGAAPVEDGAAASRGGGTGVTASGVVLGATDAGGRSSAAPRSKAASGARAGAAGRSPTRRGPGVYAFGAAVVATVIGSAVLGVKRWRAPAPHEPALATASIAASVVGVPAAPPAPAPAELGTWVTIRPTPPSATIMLDGSPLGAGEQTIERPTGSEVKLIVVSAAGYGSETVRLDREVPETIDVPLVPLVAGRARAAAAGSSAPEPAAASSAPAPRRPARVELPKNPF